MSDISHLFLDFLDRETTSELTWTLWRFDLILAQSYCCISCSCVAQHSGSACARRHRFGGERGDQRSAENRESAWGAQGAWRRSSGPRCRNLVRYECPTTLQDLVLCDMFSRFPLFWCNAHFQEPQLPQDLKPQICSQTYKAYEKITYRRYFANVEVDPRQVYPLIPFLLLKRMFRFYVYV